VDAVSGNMNDEELARTIARYMVLEQRARRRECLGRAAVGVLLLGLVAAVTLAVLAVNADRPVWAALVMSVVTGIGFVSGINSVWRDRHRPK
jgi:hypothetical protein